MKVIKKSKVKVNNLKDFYTKELSVEPTMFDVKKEDVVNGNIFRVYCDVVNDGINVVINVFNESSGVDLGTREYFIPLFPNDEKLRIKLPNEIVGLSILECLTNYEVGFENLGSGYISDWIQDDNDTKMCKIWISNEFDYMTISVKELEQSEEKTVSKEALLDQLGL